MKRIVFLFVALLMLPTMVHAVGENSKDEFWDETCLRKHLDPCGKLVIKTPPDQKPTPEEQKVLICRIKALNKCRKK